MIRKTLIILKSFFYSPRKAYKEWIVFEFYSDPELITDWYAWTTALRDKCRDKLVTYCYYSQ